ncbi:uncharacterized protein LOC123384674 [Felis catus]|uniref:uncharacterized protein LOC123384674 n=1 Tax=Felis catus TaxID=9685 RepID=UPI001D1A31DF|nr:uncharacterized protein LOC123384674 [Felis catus]
MRGGLAIARNVPSRPSHEKFPCQPLTGCKFQGPPSTPGIWRQLLPCKMPACQSSCIPVGRALPACWLLALQFSKCGRSREPGENSKAPPLEPRGPPPRLPPTGRHTPTAAAGKFVGPSGPAEQDSPRSPSSRAGDSGSGRRVAAPGTGGAGLAGDAELRRSHLEPLHLEPSPRWAVSAEAPAPPAGVSARYSGSFCVDYVWIFKASLRGGPPVIPTWREGRPPHVGDTWKVAGVASWCVRMNPAAASKPHSPPPSFVHQREPRGLPGTRRGHGGRATRHLGERSSTGRGSTEGMNEWTSERGNDSTDRSWIHLRLDWGSEETAANTPCHGLC